MYLPPARAWYCLRSHEQVADRRLAALVADALGVAGLAGLSRLLGFMAVTTLQVRQAAAGLLMGRVGEKKMLPSTFQCRFIKYCFSSTMSALDTAFTATLKCRALWTTLASVHFHGVRTAHICGQTAK